MESGEEGAVFGVGSFFSQQTNGVESSNDISLARIANQYNSTLKSSQ